MGLDMYLNKKRYLSEFDTNDRELKAKIASDVGIDASIIKEVSAEAIYWRKANSIHKWFVDHVQNGTDDCGTYFVGVHTLRELYDDVCKVLRPRKKDVKEQLALKILPPQSGFFFGSDQIDEYYWEDLKHTKNCLEKEFKFLETNNNNSKWDYEYHSSW